MSELVNETLGVGDDLEGRNGGGSLDLGDVQSVARTEYESVLARNKVLEQEASLLRIRVAELESQLSSGNLNFYTTPAFP